METACALTCACSKQWNFIPRKPYHVQQYLGQIRECSVRLITHSSSGAIAFLYPRSTALWNRSVNTRLGICCRYISVTFYLFHYLLGWRTSIGLFKKGIFAFRMTLNNPVNNAVCTENIVNSLRTLFNSFLLLISLFSNTNLRKERPLPEKKMKRN